MLWENFLIVERLKTNLYNKSFVKTYFWRTTRQQEVDYVETLHETITAYEFKWNKKQKVKIPKTFVNAYNTEVKVIDTTNFRGFVNDIKIYEANKELERILLNQGFIENTSERDKKKGKKGFKKSKQSRKEIYFDYINIRILNGLSQQESKIKITALELKALLLYFNLSSTDFKEIESNGVFKFKNVLERIKSIENELKKLTEFDLHKSRRNKLKRILDIYENVNLN